ncbi:spermidine synthase [Conexibacter arvalis]|uniref:Spermidine synthase n=1 Tax=Conexibacter arvalis TaxID=912552 RepID=A0A840IM31_9ACTN|nr:fused MFS/spermidine synthase [Conexibacter arvalis]MBB4664920.1 spermidine synthase [Conexibacter arvalis]
MASRSRSRSRTGRGGRRDDAVRWAAARVELTTPFAHAEVVPEEGRPWRRLLRLDSEDCSHVDLRDPARIDFAYVRRIADLADALAPPRAPLRVLHLGGGGFTLPRYLEATRPGSRSEVAEIDRGLVELAREQLGLRTGPRLRVRVADAREVLRRRTPGSADLVVLDAFHGTSVPEHLTTAECVAEAARALAPGGAFAANVIDVPPLPAARALTAAARAVFGDVAIVATRKVVRGRQGGNVVVLGAPGRLPLRELSRRALAGPVPELVVGGDELTAWLGGAKPLHDPPADAMAPGGPASDRVGDDATAAPAGPASDRVGTAPTVAPGGPTSDRVGDDATAASGDRPPDDPAPAKLGRCGGSPGSGTRPS